MLYTTTQTHSLGLKAGLVLGLPCRALEVTSEDQFALRGKTLRSAIEEDRARGKHPFIISTLYMDAIIALCVPQSVLTRRFRIRAVATIGTTSSGAIDRLDEIGDVGM